MVLKESGYKYDVVDAVLAEQSADPAAAARAVKQLQAWVGREDWSTILPAFARCVRIIRSSPLGIDQLPSITEVLMSEAAEKELHHALQANIHGRPVTVDELLNIVLELIPAINAFFDQVLVMAEDQAVRENRLALVGQVAGLARGVADLSKLEGF